MARRVNPERDQAKREEYLHLVQFGTQALLQTALSRQDATPEQKAREISWFMLRLHSAIEAADKIPKDASAVSAALDVVDYLFNSSNPSADDPDRTWLIDLREGRPRKHRTSWAGFIPRSTLLKWRARSRLETKRIDGKMRVEKPAWHGLPFNDSVTLEALSWVRSEGKIFLSEIARQMPKVDTDRLRRQLKSLEKPGWVEFDQEPDGSVTYQSTYKLQETGSRETLKRRLPEPTFATPTERYHARTRAARIERIAVMHRIPDARKILNAIRRRGPMQLKDLNAIVPSFTRLGLRDFMQELREAGWVQCVGRGGGAAWTGTEKLTGI